METHSPAHLRGDSALVRVHTSETNATARCRTRAKVRIRPSTADLPIFLSNCEVDTRQSTSSDLQQALLLQSIYQMAEYALEERSRLFTKSEILYVAVRCSLC